MRARSVLSRGRATGRRWSGESGSVAVDISAALTTALSGALGAFQTNVAAVVPVLAGIAVTALVIRRSLRLIR